MTSPMKPALCLVVAILLCTWSKALTQDCPNLVVESYGYYCNDISSGTIVDPTEYFVNITVSGSGNYTIVDLDGNVTNLPITVTGPENYVFGPFTDGDSHDIEIQGTGCATPVVTSGPFDCSPSTYCETNTPFLSVDMTGFSDGIFLFENGFERGGLCCGAADNQSMPQNTTERCFELMITLDENSAGLNISIAGASGFGSQYVYVLNQDTLDATCSMYFPFAGQVSSMFLNPVDVDCNGGTGGSSGAVECFGNGIQEITTPVCLDGGNTYQIFICKPGSNEDAITIESIPMLNVIADSLTRLVNPGSSCMVDVEIIGLEESSIVISEISPLGAILQLSCDDCSDPVFNPPVVNTITRFEYEVCGMPTLTEFGMECFGMVTFCDTFFVDVYPPILFSGLRLDILLCEGDPIDETISLLAPPTGGSGSGFTVFWTLPDNTMISGPAASTSSIDGTLEGQYIVEIRDDADISYCQPYTDTLNIIVSSSEISSVVVEANNALCNDSTTGEIEMTVTGTSVDYDYEWDDGGMQSGIALDESGNYTITGLGVGTFMLTVTDENGCTETTTAQITAPTALSCMVDDQENLDCDGDSDGSFDITVSGGTPMYSFELNNVVTVPTSNGGSSYTFDGLTAGMYDVEVTDANGCMTTCSQVTITEPPALSCMVDDQENLDCDGDSDGSFDITVSGGTPMYSFELNNVATVPTSNGGGSYTFDGLTAGMYDVEVTDANGCMTTCSQVTITEPTALSCMVDDQENLDCNGDSDGSFDITVSGGTPMYSFELNNVATVPTSNGGGSYTFDGLTAGMYDVEVTDANGCTTTCSQVTITAPTALSCMVDDQENLDCDGDSDGSFDITVSGGTPMYSFELNNVVTVPTSNGGSSYTFDGLTAGMYDVEVTDANGCMTTCSQVTITEPPALSCMVDDQENLDCDGDSDGSFDITVSGGTPMYSFELNNVATVPTSNGGGSYTFDGLTAGMYDVQVTDANGCMTTCSQVTITEPPALSCMVDDQENLDCNGDSDGSFDITVSGGTPMYSFELNNVATVPTSNGGGSYTFDGLTAGMYDVEVTDANGCMTTCSQVTITEPPALSCMVDDQENLDCDGDSDGSFDITVSGGTPMYSFELNNVVTVPTSNGGGSYTFDGLTAGMYDVEVTDANGCMTTCSQVTITEPMVLSCSFVSSMNGEFTLEVIGGTPAFEFTVNGMFSTPVDNMDDTYTFESLSPGLYDVDIIDDNGCQVSCEQVIIEISAIVIGDKIWHDVDGNGIQDIGELGIEDVIVELYDAIGNLVDTELTDSNGEYLFEEVPTGEYYLVLIPGNSFSVSLLHEGIDENIDNDFYSSNIGIQTDTIDFVADTLAIDGGLYHCIPIGDFVWLDYNKNNVYDLEENGLNGVPVNLYKYDVVSMSWNLTETLYTSSRPGSPSDDGYFKFCTAPGTYYLEVDFILPGYVSAVPFVGPDPEIDSDITDYFGENTTYSFSVISGDEICDLGAGYYEESTVGDYAWHDANVNGIQDEGEPKLANVTVQAYDLMGGMRSETTTNSEGYYQVSNLRHDEYFLKVIAPLGMIPTYPHMGDNVEIDNDITNDNGYLTTSTISLQSGEDKGDLDLGFVVGVVPIELISFSGRNKGSYNRLEWITAFELNHKEFVLEKRFSNEPFDDYTIIPSAGSSIEEQSYHVDDVDIDRSGVYYYRLRSLDLDGSFNYSNVVAISTDDRFNDLTLLPNPWRGGKLNLVLPDFEQITRVYIYDATKRLMYVNENLEKDQFILEIEGDDWSNGVYVVYVGTARGEYVTRMIKI